jgi:hypothetical protein
MSFMLIMLLSAVLTFVIVELRLCESRSAALSKICLLLNWKIDRRKTRLQIQKLRSVSVSY